MGRSPGATYHLHLQAHVGTTYKRALKRIHLSRDAAVPRDFRLLSLIEDFNNWSASHLLGGQTMRKPRDFDSELKAIGERAKLLQEKKLRQLGELAVATGEDTLPTETERTRGR